MEFHLGAEGGQESLGLACLNTGKSVESVKVNYNFPSF